jgi:hypothetical protein
MAATVATMSASSGVSGAAVLAGGCLTVLVVGDDDVLVPEAAAPSQRNPYHGDDDRYGCPSHNVQVPGRGSVAVRSAARLTAADVCPGCKAMKLDSRHPPKN